MLAVNNNLNILVEKLDEFIRKYYKNLLIRGLLLSVSSVLAFYLVAIISDYFAFFSSGVRTLMFFAFVGVFLTSFIFWVIDPLIRLYRLGKVISYEKASLIIGNHFPDVNDKVLNTLQLGAYSDISGQQLDLVQASITQRVKELKPVPFTAAIDLSKNRKYLRFLLPPVFVVLTLFIAAPGLLKEGTYRLVNYNSDFEVQAPFEFVLLNEKTEAIEQSDYIVQLELKGESIPAEVRIVTGTESYLMQQKDKRHFEYTFKKVSKDFSFHFTADGFSSKEYKVKILPNPSLISFEVQLEFPKYTGLSAKTISNSGDLSVPEGTVAKWLVRTKNTDELRVQLPDTILNLKPSSKDLFVFNSRLKKSGSYSLRSKNQFTSSNDSLNYYLNVVADQYPSISLEEHQDSTSLKRKFFAGEISDDYGFTKLSFAYRFIESSDSVSDNQLHTVDLPFSRQNTSDRFVYYWDMSTMSISPGDQIEYYFVVYDNDGIHGPKFTRSATRVFKAPTLEEISASTDKNNKEIKSDLESALKEAKKIDKEMQLLKQEMLEKKQLGWQDKSKLENLMERQMNLQKQIEQIKQDNKLNNQQKTEFNEMDPALLEKQKQLEEMFDKIMTDEMKKLYDELQKLMEAMNKDKVQEQMQEMEMSNKELEKELDRSLELFKQMEFEQKMENISEKLNELAEKQEKLSEDTKDKKESQENLEKRQEELNKEFENIKKDLEELNKLNEELENKKNLENTEESQEKISEEMQKSSEELDQNKNKKASESQKNASQEMKKLQQQMESMLQGMQAQQNAEDMDAIRALLENLITLSFDQEALMKEMAKTSAKDPKYIKLGQQQRKLQDDAKVIEDSLFALSKRQVSIQSIVNQEMVTINKNMEEAISNIGERKTPQANSNQQYVMTSLNNLALMLDNALQQMQQQMNSSAAGNGSCNKPGKGKPKPGEGKPQGQGQSPEQSVQSIKKMQEDLAKTLEQLKKQLEQQGQQQNGKKPGQKPGMGMPGQNGQLSKELAEMAAQQEALRRKLQELGTELNKDGSGKGNQLKKIAEQMEKNEEDIVNMNINRETLLRQQDIVTRLLESEKALRERDWDEKRQSNEAKNEDLSNSFQFLQYKRQKEKEVELLRTIPADLTPYYKNRVNEYFNVIEK